MGWSRGRGLPYHVRRRCCPNAVTGPQEFVLEGEVEEWEATFKTQTKWKSWENIMLKKQGGEVVMPFAFSVAFSQSSTVCVGGKSQEGGGLLFSRVGRKVVVLCFPPPKLQTLIVNIKGPAWPSKALEVYISPPPYLQLIPSNFPGAASFIYKLVGSTMFK